MSIDVRMECSRSLRRHGLLGGDVLVALSGGLDSVCLLRLLAEVRDRNGGRVEVAHVDHALRAESGADASFCRELAGELGCPFHAQRLGLEVWGGGKGPQAAARRARRQFFEDVLARRGLMAVALGHHADDQTETVLYRLLRGAGLRGVAGMREFTPPYVRPLLQVSRGELEALAAARNWPHREDATNRDDAYARNRLRHRVVPFLEQVHPGAAAGVRRFARLAAEDDAVLTRLAHAERQRLVVVEPEGVRLPVAGLAALEAPLRRRIYLALWSGLGWPTDVLQSHHLEQVDHLLQPGRAHRFAPLPGPGRFAVSYDQLWLLRELPVPPAMFAAHLPAPGCAPVAAPVGWLRWEPRLPAGRTGLGVPALAQGGIRVRSRLPGDRVVRPGHASRKLKELLIAAQVPLWRRSGVLVAEAGDTLFGVLGQNFASDGGVSSGGWLWVEGWEAGRLGSSS